MMDEDHIEPKEEPKDQVIVVDLGEVLRGLLFPPVGQTQPTEDKPDGN